MTVLIFSGDGNDGSGVTPPRKTVPGQVKFVLPLMPVKHDPTKLL